MTQSNLKKKYILWDLDGTVVNSENASFKRAIFSYASAMYNLKFDLSPNDYLGHTGLDVFQTILKHNKDTFVDDIPSFDDWELHAVSFLKENMHKVEARENVIDIWKTTYKLGIKHIIVTSSYKEIAEIYLRNIDLLDFCELIVGLNDVTSPKPNPEPYLTALKKMNISSNTCIAIEDSLSGVSAAKAAGLYTIAWVTTINESIAQLADETRLELNIDSLIRTLSLPFVCNKG